MANIDPVEFVASVTQAANIASELKAERLATIADDVLREHDIDKASMQEWLDQSKKGIELAKLVKSDKSYPFKNSSNIKYPLIASAALQFNARAYPAICAPSDMVKTKTFGSDRDGAKASRGERIAAHMSWQLGSQIEEWEQETDKLLVQLPVVGTMVRKVWYDPVQERIRCRVIEPGKFIVNDRTKILNETPRCGEEISLYPYEITERINAGLFLNEALEVEDSDDQKAPHDLIEQHTTIDLDGDGYPEPYIVTVHVRSKKVLRIVADFEEENVTYLTELQESEPVPMQAVDGFVTYQPEPVEVPIAIKHISRGSYFVDYHFLPSVDGKFHSTGLGLLIGDISESINSIMNMLLDAGHMASLGGGFIGNNLALKGAGTRFKPGEWKRAGSNGMDIKNSIVPLTFPSPDGTLFQMLGMLIEAGRELASVKDIMTGDSGQKNMTATTTIALIEQGMMVFTAAYKRIFRSLKKEFKLLAKINVDTVSADEYNAFHDEEMQYDPAQDYAFADMDIEPVADPQSVTKMQQAAKAQFLMQLAEAGLVDRQEASARIIEASDIGDVEALAPKPDPMQEQMMQLQAQLEQAKTEAQSIKAQADMIKAQADMIRAQAESGDVSGQAQLQLDAAKIAQDGEIARLKIAEDRRQSIEGNILALQMKKMDQTQRAN